MMLAVDIDLDKGALALAQAVWAAGRPLTWNPVQIARAAETAWSQFQRMKKPAPRRAPGTRRALTLAVVGHPYILEDIYANHRLLDRLEKLGARVLTPDVLPDGAAEQCVERLTGEAYWAYAPSLLGAGSCFLENEAVDGVVAAIAFGCAPDSGLAPVLAQEATRAGVPMLTLTLDEQSGEAGLMTRLEAFVDMIQLRKHRGVERSGRLPLRSVDN
jgi:predicted nucleotide-binding protein (sugar kinase/HSP70/actin superfamily)